jgi:transcriptional regulator with XRE-family HTH domain
MSFGKKLAKLRKDKDLTQEDLAKRIGVGVAQVRRYEKGTSSPTLEIIKNIAKTLGVSTDELIFDENEGVAFVKILDKKLLKQFEIISNLKPHDKEAVKTILESVIIKCRLEEIMPSTKKDETWSEEMREVVSELRRGAEEYSQEEIDSIVDEAVTAVREKNNRRRKKVGA